MMNEVPVPQDSTIPKYLNKISCFMLHTVFGEATGGIIHSEIRNWSRDIWLNVSSPSRFN